MVIGAILQGLSQSSELLLSMIDHVLTFTVPMFVFARIFLGHGIVYAIVAGAALLGELGHPKERAFLGAYFNAFYAGKSLVQQMRFQR